MWSNTACLKLVAQPTLALAAKYCAVKLQLRPTADGDYVDRDINKEKLDSQEVFYETAYKNTEKK